MIIRQNHIEQLVVFSVNQYITQVNLYSVCYIIDLGIILYSAWFLSMMDVRSYVQFQLLSGYFRTRMLFTPVHSFALEPGVSIDTQIACMRVLSSPVYNNRSMLRVRRALLDSCEMLHGCRYRPTPVIYCLERWSKF